MTDSATHRHGVRVMPLGPADGPDPASGPRHAAREAAPPDLAPPGEEDAAMSLPQHPDEPSPAITDEAGRASAAAADQPSQSWPPRAEPTWRGEFTIVPFEVGDPGRAASAPSFPDPDNWDIRDTVLDGILLCGDGVPEVELRAASARGRSHRYNGTVRQDAYAYRCDGRYVVAAVADGVSAGPLSHVAANIVSQSGCQLIASRLADAPPDRLDWGQILEVMAKRVVTAGRRRAAEGEPEPTPVEVARQMATTALFAVLDMRPGPEGALAVHLLAHGDTSAWILRRGEDVWEPQGHVKNAGAAVASSATAALPYLPETPPRAAVATLGPSDVLVLVSDGIGDPLGDGGGAVGAFLADRWRTPPEPLAFAAHVDFARRSHDDDRTAVALWPARPR